MTLLGWLSDPFKGLSDLQLGDEKGTLNHLVIPFLLVNEHVCFFGALCVGFVGVTPHENIHDWLENHGKFYRKYIDSFMVDFPATHVSFRRSKRLFSTGFNPHPLRVGALENADHLFLNCLEKGDARHQNLWLHKAWNCLEPHSYRLFQLDDFKPLHRKWLEITISIHFTTNRLVWGSR